MFTEKPHSRCWWDWLPRILQFGRGGVSRCLPRGTASPLLEVSAQPAPPPPEPAGDLVPGLEGVLRVLPPLPPSLSPSLCFHPQSSFSNTVSLSHGPCDNTRPARRAQDDLPLHTLNSRSCEPPAARKGDIVTGSRAEVLWPTFCPPGHRPSRERVNSVIQTFTKQASHTQRAALPGASSTSTDFIR